MVTKRKARESESKVKGVTVTPEATQRDIVMKNATVGAISVTTRPNRTGDSMGLTRTVQVRPGGEYAGWYVNGTMNGTTGARVDVTLRRVNQSGGHNHGGNTSDPIAVGSITPNSIVLGPRPQGDVICTYKASNVCGKNELAFRHSTGEVYTHFMEVVVPGLQPFPESAALELKATSASHDSPFWAATSFLLKLLPIAAAYFEDRKKPLTVIEASLMWGGCFDLRDDWRSPYVDHMDGHQASLRSRGMNRADKKAFLRLAKQYGVEVSEEGDHWRISG